MVWTVGGLVHAVADTLATRYAAVTVRGELSGFTKAGSGHCYLSLKDADGGNALLRGAMFRRAASLLDFVPADGQLVEARGRIAVYEPRGDLQFVVESMRRAGDGALFEQFLRLRDRLGAEGLFDDERKQPLPRHPRVVGVVTSLGAAALYDVLTALRRRAPHVQVVLYPSLVQGAEAPAALVAAIETASRRAEVDVLIVCRGGGSLEDLWAFNDERVVRAVDACALPAVCGVGHETDITLAELAADVRAPTPTAAAELAAPPRDACLAVLAGLAGRLSSRVHGVLDTQAQRLDRATLRLVRPADGMRRRAHRLSLLAERMAATSRRLLQAQWQRQSSLDARLRHAFVSGPARHPGRLEALHARMLRAVGASRERAPHRIHALEARLQRAAAATVNARGASLAVLAGRLEGLDPERVLARGYAWLEDGQGRAMSSVSTVTPGATIRAVLSDGALTAQVVRVHATEPEDS